MQTSTQTLRFFKHAQSARLPLPKRFRALGLMARALDQAPTLIPTLESEGVQATVAAPAKVTSLNLALLLEEAAQLVHTQLLPRIQRYRVQIATVEQLTEAQRSWLWQYFQQQVYPLLTPFVIDSSHPFPHLQPRRLNFLVVLQSGMTALRAKEHYGLLQIPARLPRLIQVQPCMPLPAKAKSAKPIRCLLWREEIIRQFLPVLFSGSMIQAVYQFRLLRAPRDNSLATLIAAGTGPVSAQGPITRLDIEKAMPPHLRQWLIQRLQIHTDQVLACAPPLGLADLCELADYLTPL